MKKQLLTLLAVMLTMAMNAEQVSRQEALQKAQQFMPGKQFGEAKALARSDDSSEGEPFYIFNADDDAGFVIVSGDNRTESILGYSDRGNINIDNMPENLRYWLEDYAQQINSLGDDCRLFKSRSRADKTAILPLIETQWDQGYPYNLMSPEFNGQHCLTGCVPTAIAQIMYYHSWPIGMVKAIPGFTTYNLVLSDLPSTSFNWEKMKKKYTGDEDEIARNAVAELMRYVAQSAGPVKDCTYGELSTYQVGVGGQTYGQLESYFGYSSNMENWNRLKSRSSQENWDNLLYEELAKKRPILYVGTPQQGTGHAFLVDGFDGNGLFHINWGWGGFCDGYFVLSAADPYMPGNKGANSNDGYNRSQVAIIGIEPSAGEEETAYDGLKYKIFPKSQAAMVQRDHYNSLKEVIIPGKITIDGTDYKITKIGFQAFVDASGLNSVQIPEGVERIESFSFNSPSLRKVEIPSTLITINQFAFDSHQILSIITHEKSPKEIIVYEDAFLSRFRLVVPDGCKDKYAKLECWKDADEIMEMSEYKKLMKGDEDFKNNVEIVSDILGDANNDGEVDQKDIDSVIQYMMDDDADDFIFKNADVNEDGKVNAIDIVILVNMMK